MQERDNDFYCLRDDILIDKRTGREIVPAWLAKKEPESARFAPAFYKRDCLVSKQVYDVNGRLVGTVSDMGYSLDGQAALLVQRQDQEIWVRLSDVAVRGDIILLKKGAVVAPTDGTVVF
jgi:sporulation protein YlmC with PRC-barrel domain